MTNRLWLAALALPFLLNACTGATPDKDAPEPFRLQRVSYADLTGWSADAQDAALAALAKSCAALAKKDPGEAFKDYAGTAADWQAACAAAPAVPATAEAARAYFEKNFTPYAVLGGKGADGLFTGYYEPSLKGSREKKAPYLTPLYARPADMFTADLGDFNPELKGKTITGRVQGEKFVPYYKRAEIEKGALDALKQEIVWVDDPVDAFFLHIQGSGIVEMEDGSVLRVGYAAQNGHAYTAIGKELIARGALAKEEVSMQTIRQWLEAHPAEAPALMDVNQSYVFFRVLEGEGPLGAQGVALTPGRSLAVDKSKIPYGAPLWLDAEEPEGGARLQRLMIAQDTGGAIRGSVRGDYFWGAGDIAAHKAGLMKSAGRFYILLPAGVVPPAPVLKR